MPSSRVVFERLSVATTVATFCLMLIGGYVKAIGAGLACPDWPTCYGTWYPFGGELPANAYPLHMVAWEWAHRFVASLVGPMILALAVLAWRQRPVERGARAFSLLAAALLPVQVGFGALTVTQLLEPVIVMSHLAFATLIFGALVATTVLALTSPHRASRQATPVVAGASSGAAAAGQEIDPALTSRPWTGPLQDALGPWFQLIKPGILFLLVLCGAAAMFLAGRPDARLVAATLVGGGLAAASAAAFNNVLDRHRDALMSRTRKRPVPSARIRPATAVAFGLALEAASFWLLWRHVNLLTAALALAAVLFYVGYTVWLKPTTAQNIVIGGAAGAGPALVGWAAVTGEIALPAVLLGFIIFLWTPPHFWALALVYKTEYEKAAVPMMPVVRGEAATRRQILVYAVLTVVATLLFVPLGTLGWIYGAAALVLGGWFVALAARLLVRKDNKTAYGLFAYSIVYLALLFGSMVVDRIVLP